MEECVKITEAIKFIKRPENIAKINEPTSKTLSPVLEDADGPDMDIDDLKSVDSMPDLIPASESSFDGSTD